ncbi:SRPBCC family protein [Nonomuraea sp. KM90]|uniref:SRPBCC family protein n=1 Tax=Nonomuraea sp. KM90 TaxID=3457428 RepID=UPI003FCC2AC9
MTQATKLTDKAVSQGQQAAESTPAGKAMPELPTGQLTSALQDLTMALAQRALTATTGKIEGLTGRLGEYAEGSGSNLLGAITGSDKSIAGSTLAGAAKGALKGIFSRKGKGKNKGGKKLKVTNIVETIDIGAPRRIVYNQWTEFQDFANFMKKVENVNQESDEKLAWKAQIFWSHRTWKSTIREQIPDERIMWRSEGDKGYVDGAVSFHALTPDFTRVMVVLEYHPKGLFEYTGNLWRAQGRRARLELKHFARHVMTQVMLKPDEMDESGWRGEIREGKVVKDHETALAEEREEAEPGEEEEPEEGEQAEYEEEPEEGEEAEYEEAEEEPEEEEPEEGEEAEYEEAEEAEPGEEEPEEGEEAEYEEEEEEPEEGEEAEYEEEAEEEEEEPEEEPVEAAPRSRTPARPRRGEQGAPSRRRSPARR